MIDYSLFAAVAALVRVVDPFTEYEDFTLVENELDDDWKHILRSCSELKADMFVKEQKLIINVDYDDYAENPTYQVSYKSLRDRDIDALEFRKKFYQYDPVLVEGMLSLFEENNAAKFYEKTYDGRIHFGVQVDGAKVYEGVAKL